jgi:hypothetical protein
MYPAFFSFQESLTLTSRVTNLQVRALVLSRGENLNVGMPNSYLLLCQKSRTV